MKTLALALALVAGFSAPAFASLESDVANAAGAGDYGMVKYLTEAGANLNVRDEEGYTPLIWAAQHGNTRVVEYLIAHGANLNPLDKGGYTPLMWACQEGHYNTVALLLSKGANPWVRNWRGQTAMDLAAMYGRDDRIREALMRLSSRPQQAPGPGWVPPFGDPGVPGMRPLGLSQPGASRPSTGTGAAPQTYTEPNMLAKVAALKRLAEVGAKASQMSADFVKANVSNPMALMDPDMSLAKDIGQLYADLARDQNLVNFRKGLDKVKASWNSRQDSKFTGTIMEADQILKDAGV